MSIIFKLTDPRGYEITCTDDRWIGHVLDEHPWMEKYLPEVKRTLTNPSYICMDAGNANKQIYYLNSLDHRSSYFKVVVEIVDESSGRLITAYKTSSGKKGEKLIWPTSQKT